MVVVRRESRLERRESRVPETLKAFLQRFCNQKHIKNWFYITIYHAVLRSL